MHNSRSTVTMIKENSQKNSTFFTSSVISLIIPVFSDPFSDLTFFNGGSLSLSGLQEIDHFINNSIFSNNIFIFSNKRHEL